MNAGERIQATPTNETAKKAQRDLEISAQKALRREDVRKSTSEGGKALSLMRRVCDAAWVLRFSKPS
jgi:hypothetical protein